MHCTGSYPKLATGALCVFFTSELGIPTVSIEYLLTHSVYMSTKFLLRKTSDFLAGQRFILVLLQYGFYKQRFDRLFSKK